MTHTKQQVKRIQMAIIGMVGLFTFRCGPEMSDVSGPSDAAQASTEQSLDKKGADNTAVQNKINAEIRQATAHYQQVERAEADGYAADPEGHCVPGMGIHYVNMAHIMDGVVDPSKPEVLVYEPMKNGRLKLVAVEFIVVAGPWDAAHAGPPMLGSQEFDDHRPPGSPGPPFPHYQLHAWVWKNNPAGIYKPFNPTVSCEYE
jgi:hypothetical protein